MRKSLFKVLNPEDSHRARVTTFPTITTSAHLHSLVFFFSRTNENRSSTMHTMPVLALCVVAVGDSGYAEAECACSGEDDGKGGGGPDCLSVFSGNGKKLCMSNGDCEDDLPWRGETFSFQACNKPGTYASFSSSSSPPRNIMVDFPPC